ncbi:Zinc transporter 2 [Bienertia sinuspersici]
MEALAMVMTPQKLATPLGFLVLGTQFAGGVFLGTSMIHFLSDASSVFENLTSIEYPFAFMLACGGYVVTMLADCIVMRVAEKSEGNEHKVGVGDEGNRDEEGWGGW